jgi:hypothetical protein
MGTKNVPFPKAALSFLRCPVCNAAFRAASRALRCFDGHPYDIARQGYVNLLPGSARASTADTPAMVTARKTFLDPGPFGGLQEFVCDAAERAGAVEGCVVEVGAVTETARAGPFAPPRTNPPVGRATEPARIPSPPLPAPRGRPPRPGP